eukprot:582877-Pleurochrysis_carterae.AAC.2
MRKVKEKLQCGAPIRARNGCRQLFRVHDCAPLRASHTEAHHLRDEDQCLRVYASRARIDPQAQTQTQAHVQRSTQTQARARRYAHTNTSALMRGRQRKCKPETPQKCMRMGR